VPSPSLLHGDEQRQSAVCASRSPACTRRGDRQRTVRIVHFGGGTICTKPGLVYLPRDEDADSLVAALKVQVEQSGASAMLTESICRNQATGLILRQSHERVETLAQGAAPAGASGAYASPALLQVSGSHLLEDPELAKEIFGPSTLIVRYTGEAN